jgi:nicotinamidase/pyrazinamidase
MKEALIVVDVQNDFVTGTMAVNGAMDILPRINELIGKYSLLEAPVFYTKDWHSHDHPSFIEQGGPWPSHCVMYADGANHPLQLRLAANLRSICKGLEKEAYSGFEGTPLRRLLDHHNVTDVIICGIATDYCVKETALDAIKAGYGTHVIVTAIKAVDPKSNAAVLDMQRAGVIFEP